MFAGSLDIFGDQGGQLGSHRGLAGVRKFLHELEQKLGLVRELLC